MRRRLYNHKTNPYHPSLWRSLDTLALALEHFGDVEKQREEVEELRKEAEKIHEQMMKAEQQHSDAAMFVDERSAVVGKRKKE